MKKQWLLFTAAAAVGILAAGIFLLPLAYTAVFRPEGIVEEEEALPGSLETAPGQFMETLWHPWGGREGRNVPGVHRRPCEMP